MRWYKRFGRPRLKTTLLGLLVPSVLGLLVFDSWSDYQTLHITTDAAYDRALLGPALALSNSVAPYGGGQLRFDIPQLALAMLESAPGQRVYYRVTTMASPLSGSAGLQFDASLRNRTLTQTSSAIITEVAGMRDLPLPAQWPSGIEPVFYNSVYRGDPVRVVAISRPLHPNDIWGSQVLVQVGESTSARETQQAAAWNSKLSRNIIIIMVMAAMLLIGVQHALRPLARLRNDVLGRTPDNLEPLDVSSVPHEISPLVHAVNHHIKRSSDILNSQTQFLMDASHQLRTPLAIMRTQVEYALREPATSRHHNSLRAILVQLERAGRLTAQLLSLANARHVQPDALQQPFDVRELVHELTLQHLPLAMAKRQDLGWDDTSHSEALYVTGNETAIVEALSNVIHNAIQYTPNTGRITVGVYRQAGQAVITIRDTGVGIPPELRESVLRRFNRGSNPQGDGSGLGLAIARAAVMFSRGTLELADGDPNQNGGAGLAIIVRLPLMRPRLA